MTPTGPRFGNRDAPWLTKWARFSCASMLTLLLRCKCLGSPRDTCRFPLTPCAQGDACRLPLAPCALVGASLHYEQRAERILGLPRLKYAAKHVANSCECEVRAFIVNTCRRKEYSEKRWCFQHIYHRCTRKVSIIVLFGISV
jgi:hypothetical protein